MTWRQCSDCDASDCWIHWPSTVAARFTSVQEALKIVTTCNVQPTVGASVPKWEWVAIGNRGVDEESLLTKRERDTHESWISKKIVEEKTSKDLGAISLQCGLYELSMPSLKVFRCSTKHGLCPCFVIVRSCFCLHKNTLQHCPQSSNSGFPLRICRRAIVSFIYNFLESCRASWRSQLVSL